MFGNEENFKITESKPGWQVWAVAVVRIGVCNENLCTVGGKFCDCVCAIDRLCNA